MIIMGILINILAALILHKVSNKLLMGIGAFAYTAAFVLVGVNRYGDSYWAFSFPALCLCVVGADFEFNVANVRHRLLLLVCSLLVTLLSFHYSALLPLYCSPSIILLSFTFK